MYKNHDKKDFFLGAMLGSTLGALTTMMFTTKNGHKMKKHILDKYHEFEEVVQGYVKDKKRKAKTKLDKKIQNFSKKISKKLSRGK